MKIKKRSMVGFCERLPLPPNYAQRFADSAACWSVDQVALYSGYATAYLFTQIHEHLGLLILDAMSIITAFPKQPGLAVRLFDIVLFNS